MPEKAAVVVLHGSWVDGALHLWAERWSAEASASRAPFSPHDPGAAGLLAAWRAIPGVPRDLDSGPQTAWLPTVAGRPAPSREVWRFAGAATEGVTLAPWQVTTLSLSWQAQFALLGACREDRRLASGVMAGQDLLVWAELFRYAGALVARAAFLPALASCGAQYESRWQPAFDGGDRRRLFLLAARLPSAARCLAAPGAPLAAASAADVAAAFVSETVDRLVRFAAVTTLSRAHAVKGRYASAHDAWLAALRGDNRSVRWEHADELATLAAEIESWRRPVELAARADWRLLLRLEEPAPDAPSRWFLRYLVQPFEHPEAVHPLASGWRGGGAAAAERGELALTSLGQAATLYPLLGRGAGAQATAGCRLTTGEAYEFLTVYAPVSAWSRPSGGRAPATGRASS